MRFRGTLVLLLLCLGLAAFLYFYEFKAGEERREAEEAANLVWKMSAQDIQQLDLMSGEDRIIATRTGDKEWRITAPRALDADSAELDRLAESAAEIRRESVVEPDSSDLARFGLDPAAQSVRIKTADGKEREIRFGNKNPTGSSTYCVVEGETAVSLVANHIVTTFDKNLEDLRNHSVLSFDQYEARGLEINTPKGPVSLEKVDSRWWIQGKERWPADSAEVSSILGALANGRLEEFFDDNPEDFTNLGLEKPYLDVRVTVGEERALKRLLVGSEKADIVRVAGGSSQTPGKEEPGDSAGTADGLFVARDESRTELFYVDRELVDKLSKTPSDLRDKSLAFFERWDIDSITLSNSKGSFSFTKTSGDWLLGEEKKKAKWSAVNGILDALDRDANEFIDAPAPLETYGLDNPSVRVILSQGEETKVECVFGTRTEGGVYARVVGESAVKIAESEVLEKLELGESDFLEAEEAPADPETSPPPG